LNDNYGRDELKHYRGMRIHVAGKFTRLAITPRGWLSVMLESPRIGTKVIDSHIWCDIFCKVGRPKLQFIEGDEVVAFGTVHLYSKKLPDGSIETKYGLKKCRIDKNKEGW
jgi:hypothetical protein